MKCRAIVFTFGLAAALACLPAAAQPNLGGLLGNILPGGGGKLGSVLPTEQAQGQQPGNSLFELLSQSQGEIDEANEIAIGRQLAAVLLGSKPLVADTATQRYVNQLGRWIALQSSRPNLPWTFGVLDDAGFNAFAAPGGFVFVTKGVLDRVDEAELAGILAHEVSHVASRHHLNALRAKARAGLATQLLGSQIRTNNAIGSMVSQQLLALGKNLYSSGLDQADEFEADRLGVGLAARSGFDPFGLPGVLQLLRAQAPDNPLFSLSLSTHPPAQQRLDTLERAMGHRLDSLGGKPSVKIPRRVATAAKP
ncbi:M48 family metalloprotease [Ramlibacter humi]|uniref:Peptidase M48 n=1 Tax=Ramlibacter humi TaxID=2530451 RepID=A0A4Z0BK76_9BURK|nr:M48 family metalloprotease [Ramlibacter humi]TFY98298.1 peptidase M48 [Ramlibacter humi]